MVFLTRESFKIMKYLHSKQDKKSSLKELASEFGYKPRSPEYGNLHISLNSLEKDGWILSKKVPGRRGRVREVELVNKGENNV